MCRKKIKKYFGCLKKQDDDGGESTISTVTILSFYFTVYPLFNIESPLLQTPLGNKINKNKE